jgi:hypothetical protein
MFDNILQLFSAVGVAFVPFGIAWINAKSKERSDKLMTESVKKIGRAHV